jgi:cytochrome b561
MHSDAQRYHGLAIALHWIIALAIILMLASGLVMKEMELAKDVKFQLYQWHKSLGVLVLCAVLLRVVVRLLTHPPALPARMKLWERKAAGLGHFALYGLMLAMPLTGWAVVSSSVYGLPTMVFGWFEWPHIPGLAGNEMLHDLAEELHENFALLMMFVIAVHLAAVVKHYVVDKENLLPRMGIGKAHKES